MLIRRCQEEHKNHGAWHFIFFNFKTVFKHAKDSRKIRYIGRPTAASPATGNYAHFGFFFSLFFFLIFKELKDNIKRNLPHSWPRQWQREPIRIMNNVSDAFASFLILEKNNSNSLSPSKFAL